MMSEGIKKEMDRRSFFKWSGLSVLGMIIVDKVRPSLSLANGKPKDYWNEDGYFRQDNVDVSNIDQGIVRAKVEGNKGKWQDYNVVDVEINFQNLAHKEGASEAVRHSVSCGQRIGEAVDGRGGGLAQGQPRDHGRLAHGPPCLHILGIFISSGEVIQYRGYGGQRQRIAGRSGKFGPVCLQAVT